MTCDEAAILLHAFIDGELDAGHARDVEGHLQACQRCAADLRDFRVMRTAMSDREMQFAAPPDLRQRLDGMLPAAKPRSRPRSSQRWSLFGGFILGSAVTAAAAASLMFTVMRADQGEIIAGELVSAHLRSLQAERLTDVATSDQHTVKPWFNGKLDVAPPVVDLTNEGFALIGGRLDYIEGHAVAAIVYRRQKHIINLFVTPDSHLGLRESLKMVQGFNVKVWSEQGLYFGAVSDLNSTELQEFEDKFEAATRP